MPAIRVPTRLVTLHRLPLVSPETMINAIDVELADELGSDLQFPAIAGMSAIWIDGCLSRDETAEWCQDASITTGLHIDYRDRRSGGLLVVAIDGTVYAIGYGQQGHRLLLDEHKDQRFGLSFAIRALNPHQVHDLQRRFPTATGRTDITYVPGGLPIYSFGISPAEIIRSVGGALREADLAFCRDTHRDIRIEGSAGLRLRLGVRPTDLVADIREVARIYARDIPDPLLKFVDNVRPVRDQLTRTRLDQVLEGLLSRGSVGEAALATVVPTTCIKHLPDTRSYAVRVGRHSRSYDHLELDVFMRALRTRRPGNRLEALRDGRILMCSASDGHDPLAGAMAIKWLEATCSLDSRRFHLLDGQWYEIGAGYLFAVRDEVERILRTPPALDLPTWERGWSERRYNEAVPVLRSGYVCLDRRGVPNPLKTSNRIEICDLLGPDDELIHVKQAEGSAPLSHLFNQALVSTQSLAYSPQVREDFAAFVRKAGRGRVIAPDFQPKKVILAILIKNRAELTPGSLFPFSQVTLAHTATTLRRQHQVDVEVIGIPQAA